MKFTQHSLVALTCTSVAVAASLYASQTTQPELERVASESVRTAVPDSVTVCPGAPRLPESLTASAPGKQPAESSQPAQASQPAQPGEPAQPSQPTGSTQPAPPPAEPTPSAGPSDESAAPGSSPGRAAIVQVMATTPGSQESPAASPTAPNTQQVTPKPAEPQPAGPQPSGPQPSTQAAATTTPGPRQPVDSTVQTVRVVAPKARGGAPQVQLVVPSRKDGKPPAVVSSDVARSGDAWIEQVRPAIFDRQTQAQPIIASAASDGQQRRPLGGVSLSLAVSGDLRGLTAAGCLEPQSDTWLVGGSLSPGTTSRLVISNPSKTTSSVSITLFTDSGQIEPVGGQRMVLAAGTSREMLLGGLLTGSGPISVRVRASDAPVAAYVATHTLDGLVPHGVSIVSPAVKPQERAVVVGPGATAKSGKRTLRIVNPHPVPVVSTWQGISADGIVNKGAAVTVAAQSSVDVDLGSGADVASAVIVEGERPITAAMQTIEETGLTGDATIGTREPVLDHAWFAAAAALPDSESQRVVIARPGTSKVDSVLRVAAAKDATVRWLPLSSDGVVGKGGEVNIPAKRVVEIGALPESAAAVMIWSTSGAVAASVVASHPSIGVAGYPVMPGAATNVVEAVRPVPPGVMP